MTILTVTLHPALDKVLVLPKLSPNEVNRTQVAMLYGGGKGNNVARALVRLGIPSIATGYQGGYIGEYLIEKLSSEGIKTDFVTCKQPTRTSTLVQEQDTGYTYALYEPGQTVDEEEVDALMDKFGALLKTVSLCLLCGSGQTPLLGPVYARMINLARLAGVRCLLDSSGEALARGIDAKPTMVKVNEHELSDYLQRPLDDYESQIQAILELHAHGIEIVALSRGKEGMIATNGKEIWEAQLTMEHVINVVGCGDSLLAGIAKALMENASLKELVRWGVACGTANTQVRGAGYIEPEMVNKLLSEVRLHQVQSSLTQVATQH
jgi:1-phosphofructokinase family hexose kinase